MIGNMFHTIYMDLPKTGLTGSLDKIDWFFFFRYQLVNWMLSRLRGDFSTKHRGTSSRSCCRSRSRGRHWSTQIWCLAIQFGRLSIEIIHLQSAGGKPSQSMVIIIPFENDPLDVSKMGCVQREIWRFPWGNIFLGLPKAVESSRRLGSKLPLLP